MDDGLIAPINGLKQIAINIVKQVTSGNDYWTDRDVRNAIIAESNKISGFQTTLLNWMDIVGNCDDTTDLENSRKVLAAIKSLDVYIIFYMFNETLFTRLSGVLTQMNMNITTGEPLSLKTAIDDLIKKANDLAIEYLAAKNISDKNDTPSAVKQNLRVKETRVKFEALKTSISGIISELEKYEKLNKNDYTKYIDNIENGSYQIDGVNIGTDVSTSIVKEMLLELLNPESPDTKEMKLFVNFMIDNLTIKSESFFKGFWSSTSKSYDNFIITLKSLNENKIKQFLTTFDARSTMMEVYTAENDLKKPKPQFNVNFPFKYSEIQKISNVDLDDLNVVIEYAGLRNISDNENIIIAWCKCVIIDLFGLVKKKKLKEAFSGGRGTKNKRRITNYTRKNIL